MLGLIIQVVYQKSKTQKEAGKITWDIMDVFAMDTITGCDEGLFVEFDFDKDFPPAPDGTPASKDFFTAMPSKCAVGNILYFLELCL